MIQLSKSLIAKLKEISLFILSASVVLRFDFLFGGANRFIPFRVFMVLTIFWLFIQFLKPFIYTKIPKAHFYFLLGFLVFFSVLHLFWIDSMESIGPFLRNQFHFIYILSGFFLTRYLILDMPKSKVQRLVKFILVLVILVVSIETLLRFFMPTLDLNSESTDYLIEIYTGAQGGLSLDSFYFFKMSSIMFFDSNYVGAFLLIFLALNQFSSYSKRIHKTWVTCILLGLIFFTLSRAAILVSFIWVIFNFWNSKSFVPKWVFAFSCLIMSLVVLFYFQDELAFSDGSLLTKLQILEGLSGFFNQDLTTALVGLGYEVGGYLYSYMSGGYAHIHIAILLGELGLLGTLVYLFYWYYMGLISGIRVLFILIPFLIVGMSLADPWEIGYFWASAIIARL